MIFINTKQEKAKKIIKESILKKEYSTTLDTNITIDYLKANEKLYSTNNTHEYLKKRDIINLLEFLKNNKILIFNLECINNEISKKIHDLISTNELTNKSKYYYADLIKDLNYSEIIYKATDEEIELSEEYGKLYTEDTFGRKEFKKDDRTDLLIYLISKRIGAKIIITSDGDFTTVKKIYKENINPNDPEELLILKPTDMITVIEELKSELE